MTFLAMPGGSEMVFLMFLIPILLIVPFLAIRYYTKYKELKKQNQILLEEKNRLLEKILQEK